jgi:prevent-host-death family protein
MAELSVREVREHLADAINAAIRGQVTYITSRGRRVAAIVPLAVAGQAEDPAPSLGTVVAPVERHPVLAEVGDRDDHRP